MLVDRLFSISYKNKKGEENNPLQFYYIHEPKANHNSTGMSLLTFFEPTKA